VTAISSVAYAVLVAAAPFPASNRVVRVFSTNPIRQVQEFSTSEPDYVSFGERTRLFDTLAAMAEGSANVIVGGQPLHLVGLRVTPSFWPTLGIHPLAGRAFLPSEAEGQPAAVVMLSEGLWARQYGSNPAIVGSVIDVDGVSHTVVGIAAQDVGFSTTIDLWRPFTPDRSEDQRGDRRVDVVGRLKPGVTLEQANAELGAVAAGLARDYPESDRDWGARAVPIGDWIVSQTLRRRVTILLAAVTMLLLVACANVATLQVARAASRVREIAVRLALGASRARLLRQMTTEGLLLTVVGSVIGVLLAWMLVRGAATWLPATMPRAGAVTMNAWVLAAALGAVGVTVLVTGLLPAAIAARASIALALTQAGRSPAGQARQHVRQALVGVQVALATTLVIAAALVAQSLAKLEAVPLGIADPDRVLIARVPRANITEDAQPAEMAFFERLMSEVRALPGVREVGIVSEVPLGAMDTQMPIVSVPREPAVPEKGMQASWRLITAGYLRAMGIPLLRGELFAPSHDVGRRVILNDTAVRRLWPSGADPIGRQVKIGNGQTLTVIGVVGDVRQNELGKEPTPTMYFSAARFLWPTMALVVRTSVDPATLGAALRDVVRRVDPLQPIFDVSSMRTVIRDSSAEPRVSSVLLMCFAGLALLLAGTGVAGVVAYSIAQRLPELAVRLALGASPRHVVRHVMKGGLLVCVAGVAVGALAALAVGQLLASVLFGIRPNDPITIVSTVGVLLAIAALASWLPARRAARVDPCVALKAD
jgi:putative ABC transport system permease protein